MWKATTAWWFYVIGSIFVLIGLSEIFYIVSSGRSPGSMFRGAYASFSVLFVFSGGGIIFGSNLCRNLGIILSVMVILASLVKMAVILPVILSSEELAEIDTSLLIIQLIFVSSTALLFVGMGVKLGGKTWRNFNEGKP